MRRRPQTTKFHKITFLGPIQWEKESTILKSVGFLLLQLPTSPIKLSYDTERQARAARQDLLKNPNTHSLPSLKLLMAVYAASQQLLSSETKLPPE